MNSVIPNEENKLPLTELWSISDLPETFGPIPKGRITAWLFPAFYGERMSRSDREIYLQRARKYHHVICETLFKIKKRGMLCMPRFFHCILFLSSSTVLQSAKDSEQC